MNNLDKLPDICASRLHTTGEAIFIKRSETGYYPADGQVDPDEYNEQCGITPAQVAAMEAGSMFGWHVPAADPENQINASRTEFPYKDRL